MTPDAIKKLQAALGVSPTGVFDAATSAAMSAAIGRSISTNPDVIAYSGANDPSAILNAYMSGDWSGVTSLSGKPFTDEQMKEAQAQAERALAPAYQAQEANDRAQVEESLRDEGTNLADFRTDEAGKFGKDKEALDQNAADQGILFSGSRLQKQNDLRTAYQDADARAMRDSSRRMETTLRGHQYDYGNDAATGLSRMYQVPGSPQYNAGVAGGKVTPGRTLSAVYDPRKYNFQGTKPVAQKAAVYTRAAGLLANRANKLTMSGTGTQF